MCGSSRPISKQNSEADNCTSISLVTFPIYVLFTVRLGIILVNNPLAHFFSCMFISILYMFRAAMYPSSGELIVSIHLVYVTLCRRPSGVQVKTARQTVVYT